MVNSSSNFIDNLQYKGAPTFILETEGRRPHTGAEEQYKVLTKTVKKVEEEELTKQTNPSQKDEMQASGSHGALL